MQEDQPFGSRRVMRLLRRQRIHGLGSGILIREVSEREITQPTRGGMEQ